MLIYFNDELKDSLDSLISGILPHEGYDSSLFMDIHDNILRYIKEDEMPLEYKTFFSIVSGIMKINISASVFNPIISRDSVDAILTNSLGNFVSCEGYKYKEWFENRGISSSFTDPLSIDSGASALYNEVIELYDRCYDLNISSAEALSQVVSYRVAFTESVSLSSVKAQAEILQSRLYYKRKYYKGPSGWIDFMNETLLELNERLNDEVNSESNHLDSLDKVINYLEKARNRAIPLSSYGIPPLDDAIPLVSNRLTVICSNEGIGKTQFCTYLANNVIKDNKRVLYMFGESDDSELFTIILRNFIYKKYKCFVDVKDILHPEKSTEDIQKIINMATTELYKTKGYIDRSAYTYETLYEQLVDDYNKYKFDVVIIDHSAALNSNGSLRSDKEKIDALAIACRNFKRNFPCQVIVTSHLSVEAKQELSRHGKVFHASPTRDSGTLSKEADDVYIITVDEKLEKQDLRAIQVSKRRGASKHSIGNIIMKVLYSCGEWVYDKKYQSEEYNTVEVDAAIKNVESVFLDSDEEIIEIEL